MSEYQHMISSSSAIKLKEQARAENERKVKEFLARGNQITVCDSCVSTRYKHGHEYLRSVKAT